MLKLVVRSVVGFALALALMPATVLSAAAVQTQDCVRQNREMAKTWGMNRIALMQAAAGDVQGTKHTLSQIDEDGPPGPVKVTVVSFIDGQPIYDCPVAEPTPGWGGRDSRGTQYFLVRDRAADRVPAQVPANLPSDYLAPDPRHGAVVDFTDECDANGTRVTSRRYADGYAVIETPHTGRK